METISKSVGRSGINLPSDVKIIQIFLNKISSPTETTPLKVDGKIGEKTLSRIEAFQKKNVFMAKPDGRIDPNGKTFNKLLQVQLQSRAITRLTLSTKSIDLLKSIEELATSPYDDQSGKDIKSWVKGATIGYGHLIAQADWEKYKNGITEAKAIELFKSDLSPFESKVNTSLTTTVTQHEFDALVILAFNIGLTAFAGSSVLKLVNDSKAITSYASLESAWKAWSKSQDAASAGLVNRRQAEWNVYSKNIYKKW